MVDKKDLSSRLARNRGALRPADHFCRAGQKGFSLLSLMGALLVVGCLYLAYNNTRSGVDQVTAGQAVADTSRDMACQVNRQALGGAIMTWSISHPGTEPTLETLKRDGVTVVPCPRGGDFTIQGRTVSCSVHP